MFPNFFSKIDKNNFFSKMTSAIIHNDTSISLLVTNNYYDDTHVFMCNN